MTAARARFGGLTLIAGPESFLAERALAAVAADLRRQDPGASMTTAAADQLDLGQFQAMTGADLFASSTIAALTGLEKLPKALEEPLLKLAAAPPPAVALIGVHAGGNTGRKLLDQLRPLAAPFIDCPVLKGNQFAGFVTAEARALGGSADAVAAQQLVEAVGADTRALAAAVSQLLDDSEEGRITAAQVRRYFAGRATVTGFAVADDCLAGRTGEAVVKLRWALATGTSPAAVTSALANSLRQLGKYYAAARRSSRPADIAAATGAPPWKVRDLAALSRAWDERSVAQAIQTVARADAAVKGAAGDPDFALEQTVLTVAGLRRAAAARSVPVG
ncbi:MAG: DNA polymerase III subunit delta [Propionibacteriaceae bacterium]|nr:DNA polymerase III subunit delta [Propionibacteriaceae bacterium]